MNDDFSELFGDVTILSEDELKELEAKEAAEDGTTRLGQLMLDCCPYDEYGQVGFPHLARLMGITPQAIYNIVSRNRITYRRAVTILKLKSDTAYSIADFEEWLR